MQFTRLKGSVCMLMMSLGFMTAANAALIGRLPATTGGTDYQAYYDDVLKITWAADANINGVDNWANQNTWAAGLSIGGVSGWRLPTVSPINGNTYNTGFSNNATTDFGFADSAGWVDGLGKPTSEMGHLFYVTLGNLGQCTPNGGGSSASCITQSGFGLTNTGPFSNVQSSVYWSGIQFASNPASAWGFDFEGGFQGTSSEGNGNYAWAVHSGDVSAVPVPGAVWLLGSGLIGLVGFAKRRGYKK